MAIYEFHCEKCHVNIDLRRTLGDVASPICQKCWTEMRRVWTAPNILGATQFCDSAFRVEKIALGRHIRSTKDIDRMGAHPVGNDYKATVGKNTKKGHTSY